MGGYVLAAYVLVAAIVGLYLAIMARKLARLDRAAEDARRRPGPSRR